MDHEDKCLSSQPLCEKSWSCWPEPRKDIPVFHPVSPSWTPCPQSSPRPEMHPCLSLCPSLELGFASSESTPWPLHVSLYFLPHPPSPLAGLVNPSLSLTPLRHCVLRGAFPTPLPCKYLDWVLTTRRCNSLHMGLSPTFGHKSLLGRVCLVHL